MYELQLIGRLGKDAEVKTTDYGTFLNFSVAHNEKRSDGSKNTDTVWTIVRFKPRESSTIAQYLKKGVSVYLKGRPGAYVGNDGEVVLTLTAYQLELIGGTRNDNAQKPSGTAPCPADGSGIMGNDPDLPF